MLALGLVLCLGAGTAASPSVAVAGTSGTKYQRGYVKRQRERRVQTYRRSRNKFSNANKTQGGHFTTFKWVPPPPRTNRNMTLRERRRQQRLYRPQGNYGRRSHPQRRAAVQRRSRNDGLLRAKRGNCMHMRWLAKRGNDWQGMVRQLRRSPLGTTPVSYQRHDTVQRLWVYNSMCKFSVLERWSLVAMWARATSRKPPPPPHGWRLWPAHHYNRLSASSRRSIYGSSAESSAFERRNPIARQIIGVPLGRRRAGRR